MDDDDLELVFPAFIVAARMSAAAFNCASVMLLKLLKSISGTELNGFFIRYQRQEMTNCIYIQELQIIRSPCLTLVKTAGNMGWICPSYLEG